MMFKIVQAEFLGAGIKRIVIEAPGIARKRPGLCRPVPVEGSEFDLPLSVGALAIGTAANPMIQGTTPSLKTNQWGYIEADPGSQRTSRKGIFAGGDIATGSATVILAMGTGRRAAKYIHEYLTTDAWGDSSGDTA